MAKVTFNGNVSGLRYHVKALGLEGNEIPDGYPRGVTAELPDALANVLTANCGDSVSVAPERKAKSTSKAQKRGGE